MYLHVRRRSLVAAHKAHFCVRHFGRVVTIPVVKQASTKRGSHPSHTVDGGRAGVDRERFRPFHAILTEAQKMKENAYFGPLRPESFACGGLLRACAGDHIISGTKAPVHCSVHSHGSACYCLEPACYCSVFARVQQKLNGGSKRPFSCPSFWRCLHNPAGKHEERLL